MTDLIAARLQMGLSLAFHIVFAVVGIGMPVLMVIAEALWLRTGDAIYRDLAKRWARGTAILFAVGAVSGTVLAFELGLLWPHFMHFAGPIFGVSFSLEGFAFFLEAIFLGIYLYGWDRVPPRAHLFAGVVIALAGTASGVFVSTANAWMNTPAGFRLVDGRATDISPLSAMLNPASGTECVHVALSAFVTLGFLVSAVHAYRLLRAPGSGFHRRALKIALPLATVSAVLQPISGDFSAQHVAEQQPVKLAAMEGQWETERGAPLRAGGWVFEDEEVTRYAIEIPYGLSLLSFHDPMAEIHGLREVPRADRPPAALVHLAFQLMVGCGLFMAGVGLLGALLAWRRRRHWPQRWYLKLVIAAGPVGVVALQAGWMVTELGRQPWIVRGVMRTADAVTPMPHLIGPLIATVVLYTGLALIVFVLLTRVIFRESVAAESAEEGSDDGA